MTTRSTPTDSSVNETAAIGPDVLLQSCADGDRLAFAVLYRATSAKLFGICLHYLGNRAEAEEVLQEVYTTAWLKASSFDPTLASALTWLATLARHRAIDRRRAQHRHQPLETVSDWPAQDTPLDSVEQERQGNRIDRCLATLEDNQQHFIRVAFFEGWSYAELAQRYDIPLGTMKSWIRRGLLRLRLCLGL